MNHHFNQFVPNDDGTTHINIFSKGNTELGRRLSHYSYSPFIHPYFGPFKCMEGFWYYLRAVKPDDKLRELVGAEAKFYGKELETHFLHNFQKLIVDANYQKIIQNPEIKQMVMESTLPFDHYYTFGTKQVRLPQFIWLIEGFEEIRRKLNEDETFEKLNYEELLK